MRLPISLLLFVTACGGESSPPAEPRPDARVLVFDAAMLDPLDAGGLDDAGRDAGRDVGRDGGRDGGLDGGLDGGRDEAELLCTPGRVGNTTRGVLTNFPTVDVRSLDVRFSVRSASYVVRRDGDSRGPLLTAFFELENVSRGTHCELTPRTYFGGVQLFGLVSAPPHFLRDLGSTVTSQCMAPGERGIYRAVARGIDVADLEAGGSLTLDFPGSLFDQRTTIASTAQPRVMLRPETVPEGTRLVGNASFGTTIRNYALELYVRDLRQLYVAELEAYPGELETLVAGTTAPVESSATPCTFDTWQAFHTWIQDSRASFARAEPSPNAALRDELRRRARELTERRPE